MTAEIRTSVIVVDRGAHDGPLGGPPGSRIVEWFRAEPRPSLHVALLPAILCATIGWLLLSVAGRMIASRPPHFVGPVRATLPAAAIVDATGAPAEAVVVEPAERVAVVFGTFLVLMSPLALVVRLRARGRASVVELLLRTDALVVRDARAETAIAWDELEEARLDRGAEGGDARITLARHDGTELGLDARFPEITPEELVLRIRAVRGRALFGLLEPPAWPERARGR